MDPESLQLEENRGEMLDSQPIAKETIAQETPAQEATGQKVAGRGRGITHVLTLEEIANLAADEGQPAETLMNVLALIAKRFESAVCSAYLLYPYRATRRLHG